MGPVQAQGRALSNSFPATKLGTCLLGVIVWNLYNAASKVIPQYCRFTYTVLSDTQAPTKRRTAYVPKRKVLVLRN
jgi:hypothetical protein